MRFNNVIPVLKFHYLGLSQRASVCLLGPPPGRRHTGFGMPCCLESEEMPTVVLPSSMWHPGWL